MNKVKAKNTKDIVEHINNNKNKLEQKQQLSIIKNKKFLDLTQEDKDNLLKLLFIRAGFISE